MSLSASVRTGETSDCDRRRILNKQIKCVHVCACVCFTCKKMYHQILENRLQLDHPRPESKAADSDMWQFID